MNFRKVIFIQCLFLATFNLFGPKRIDIDEVPEGSQSIFDKKRQVHPETPNPTKKKKNLTQAPFSNDSQDSGISSLTHQPGENKSKFAINKALPGYSEIKTGSKASTFEEISRLKATSEIGDSLQQPSFAQKKKKTKKVSKKPSSQQNPSLTLPKLPEDALQTSFIREVEVVAPVPTLKRARTMLNSKENELAFAVKAVLEPKGLNRTIDEKVDNFDLNSFLAKKQDGENLSEKERTRLYSLASYYLPDGPEKEKMLEEFNAREKDLENALAKEQPPAPKEAPLTPRFYT